MLKFRSDSRIRATRISNIERRVAALADATSAHKGALDKVTGVTAELKSQESRIAQGGRTNRTPQASPTSGSHEITDSLVLLGRRQGLDIPSFLSINQAAERVQVAVDSGKVFDAVPFLESYPGLARKLGLTTQRNLLKGLRRLGYLEHSVSVIREIAANSGKPSDERALAIYTSELALYRGEVDLDLELPSLDYQPRGGVVLHFVGKALPETQSGYTLRTQYTVEAQRRVGMEPVVVAQAGASDRPHLHTETYEHNGIRHYLLGGPQRGAGPWDTWIRENVERLAEVVRLVQPSLIHAHSDFINAMIALPVARAYNIPLVNETRGFWEESWLSRVTAAENWNSDESGWRGTTLPDMYRLRVEREAKMRNAADGVVTLASVMRDHIERVGENLGYPVPKISIAPNAVEAEQFPVLGPNADLRQDLSIPRDATVIGYISSIVEYEGIDTLIRAMHELELAVEAVARSSTHAYKGAVLEGTESPLLETSSSDRATGGIEGAARQRGDSTVDSKQIAIMDLLDKLSEFNGDRDIGSLTQHSTSLVNSVSSLTGPIVLVIVGDGAQLASLKALATQLGVKGVKFTGRVAHDRVLEYYGLIDLFVVPRKKAAVTELVTPLKPFEAMSTGRPCIFSDVGALAEIARDSGAVQLFMADDHCDLSATMAQLIADPDQMAIMARKGADWVRRERRWDGNALTYLEFYSSIGVNLGTSAA
ncbi:glycosyltransferase [Isoptericola chiayiensis]|nr:glycosyltransferase [Isoptericola chiayiensis]